MNIEEKVFRIYEVVNQRVTNEDRLLAERASLFLLVSSILFAGFAMLIGKSTLLTIVIPCSGIFLSVLMWSTASAMIRELRLWLVICQKIEQEDNAFNDLKEKEQIPHTAWNHWWIGKSRYIVEEQHPFYLRLPPLAKWEKRVLFGILDSWKTYRFYIPGIFLVIWVTSLVWALLQTC